MVYFKLEFGFGRSKRAERAENAQEKEKNVETGTPGYNELPTSEKRGRDFIEGRDSVEGLDFAKGQDFVKGWDFVTAEVNRAKQEQRFKIAQNYLTAARSWTQFMGNEEWCFSDMTADKLAEYQRWLIGRRLCMNTISAYMRALRAMYRRCEGEGGNPFAKVFTGRARTAKRSITQAEMLQLKTLPLQPDSPLAFARDLFLFSFYAMGMPFVDIAYLRKFQIYDGCIHYERHKTGQRIEVALQPAMLDILRRYEQDDSSEFLFPILSKLPSDASPAQLHRLYTARLRQYNYSLHRLSQMMGLPKPLSSYVVRHSWASLAYQHHLDIGLIGKALGHTKSSTTFIYIKSLFDADLAEANQALMNELGL